MERPEFDLPPIEEPSEEPAAVPAPEADRTQVVPPPNANTTQAIAPSQCPICKSFSPPGGTYCGDCGFLLSSQVVAQAPQEAVCPLLRDASSGREYLLRSGENSVGRENCDVLLAHPSISRKHAVVTLADDGIWLEDAGSSNGTKLAGERLAAGDRRALYADAQVEFGGSATLTLVLPTGWEGPIAAPAARPEAEGPHARLVGTTDAALTFTVPVGAHRLGRKSGADIVVANPYVSGTHAELSFDGAVLTVTDLGSTNGTLINGAVLTPNTPVEAPDGGTLAFGQCEFRVEIVPAAAGDPTTPAAEPETEQAEPEAEA
jgi:pSer/pThr/pTyr-binding forkhead associated (FHA) protein